MDMAPILVSLFAMLLLLGLGVHVFACLGIAGFVGLLYLNGGNPYAAALVAYNQVNSPSMAVVAVFLLMGNAALELGFSSNLISGAAKVFCWLRGSLMFVTVAACALFAAISGSSSATVAAIGTMAYKDGVKRGYGGSLFLGTIAAGGTLGVLIPPSVIMIVYGLIAEQSIAKLFMAGMVPGLVAAAIFATYVAIRIKLNPSLVPDERQPMKPRLVAQGLLEMSPMLVVIAIVLGSIYTGFATPTEAAVLGTVGVIGASLISRSFSWGGLSRSLKDSALTTTMILFLMMGAGMLSSVLASSGVGRAIATAVAESGVSPYILLLGISVLYMVMGMFFDSFSIMLVTLPLMLPAVLDAGFDPIWFGVVVTILMETGQITPPFGMNLFVLDGITGTGIGPIAKGSVWYVVLLCLVIVLLTIFPDLALWLPSTM